MLKKRGVEFLSLNEAIDTASTAGTLIFHLFAAFAEFERCLISDRTIAGLAAARAKGKILGRRRRLTDDQSAALFHAIVFEKEPPAVVAERFGVHPRTANRYVARTLERSIQSSGSGKGR
jgi:DNA invertase Pin-like site-specific DNA recombinase